MNNVRTIGYFAGPGDACDAYRKWLLDRDFVSRSTYTGQFYKLLSSSRRGVVISGYHSNDEITSDNAIIINLPYLNSGSGILYILKDIAYKIKVARLFRSHGVGLAFVQSDWDVWTCIVFNIYGVKVINSIHCSLGGLSNIVSFLNKIYFRFFSSGVMAVSRKIISEVSNLCPSLSPLESFMPSLSFEQCDIPVKRKSSFLKSVSFLYVGRVEINKGVIDLVYAFSKLVKYDPSVQLCIAGSGAGLEKLRSLVSDLELEASVFFYGDVPAKEVSSLYSKCDVVVVPTSSRFAEGFNKVVLEGVAYSCPVIATSVCPAVDEIESGIIIVPPDDPHSLFEAMKYLLIYENRISLTESSSISLRKFLGSKTNWSSVAEFFLEIY